MKRFLSLCLLASVFGSFSAQAYDFYLKGVYYNKTSDSTVAIYDLRGHRLPDLQRGINIIRYSDGSAKKILVK